MDDLGVAQPILGTLHVMSINSPAWSEQPRSSFLQQLASMEQLTLESPFWLSLEIVLGGDGPDMFYNWM